jgi:hypothetical protein
MASNFKGRRSLTQMYPDRSDSRYCSACDEYRPFAEFYMISLPKRRMCKKHIQAASAKHHCQRTYGLSPNELVAFKEERKSLCEICLKPGSDIDHDHVSNKVRGYLCRKCNLGLGCFDDNAWRMLRAAQYVNEHLTVGEDTWPKEA